MTVDASPEWHRWEVVFLRMYINTGDETREPGPGCGPNNVIAYISGKTMTIGDLIRPPERDRWQ